MSIQSIRLIALDLDGTLTQHKTPSEERNRRAGGLAEVVLAGHGSGRHLPAGVQPAGTLSR